MSHVSFSFLTFLQKVKNYFLKKTYFINKQKIENKTKKVNKINIIYIYLRCTSL